MQKERSSTERDLPVALRISEKGTRKCSQTTTPVFPIVFKPSQNFASDPDAATKSV